MRAWCEPPPTIAVADASDRVCASYGLVVESAEDISLNMRNTGYACDTQRRSRSGFYHRMQGQVFRKYGCTPHILNSPSASP